MIISRKNNNKIETLLLNKEKYTLNIILTYANNNKNIKLATIIKIIIIILFKELTNKQKLFYLIFD